MARADKRKQVMDAAKAHTDISIFEAVISLLEGSSSPSSKSHEATFQIIRIAKAEQQRCLRRMDAAIDAALSPAQKGEA